MWAVVAAFTIWAIPAAPPPAIPQRPYVSCIDGHIVAKLSECPPLPKHNNNPQNAPVGGGGSGLLGGLLGGLL